jgi:hypothetical protein
MDVVLCTWELSHVALSPTKTQRNLANSALSSGPSIGQPKTVVRWLITYRCHPHHHQLSNETGLRLGHEQGELVSSLGLRKSNARSRSRLEPDNTFQLSDHTVCCVTVAPKYLGDPCHALPSDAVESLQPCLQTESSNTSQPSSSSIARSWCSQHTSVRGKRTD